MENDLKISLEMSIDRDNHVSFLTSIDEALLDAERERQELIEQINDTEVTIKSVSAECDKSDYVLAVTCGALCGIIDIFLVGKPGESPLDNVSNKWFAECTKNFAKLFGWKCNNGELSSAIRYLEKRFKVPYDQRGAGDSASFVFDLNPSNHHFKSLAHNPTLLGLFFSILDQFTNQSHFVSDSRLISLQKADNTFELRGNNTPSKLFCGFVNWFGHIVSDMSGSSNSKGHGAGIPSPFWSWTNDIIAMKNKLNIPSDEFDKTLNDLALKIYNEGYDIRFQAAQAIPVIINEILVRLIYSVRRMMKYFITLENKKWSFKELWRTCEPFLNATVKRMVTVAHGTFCMLDVGDAVARAHLTTKGKIEFIMRLNIIGMGRFVISLYGEIDREAKKSKLKEDTHILQRDKKIIENYIEDLKFLSNIYDDQYLVVFVGDLEKSDLYKEAFIKSTKLARKRKVSPRKILHSKDDIDNYFIGGNKICSKRKSPNCK